MPLRLVDGGKNHEDIGQGGVRDEGLRTVQDVLVPFLDGGGRQGAGVGPAAGLGEPHAADPLGSREFGKVFQFLLLGAVLHDVGAAEVGVGAPGQGVPAVRAGVPHGLSRQAAGYEIRARSAVLFGIGKPEEPHARHLPEDLHVKFSLQIRLFAERRDFLLGETVDRFPEHSLFIGKCEIHVQILLMLGCCSKRRAAGVHPGAAVQGRPQTLWIAGNGAYGTAGPDRVSPGAGPHGPAPRIADLQKDSRADA